MFREVESAALIDPDVASATETCRSPAAADRAPARQKRARDQEPPTAMHTTATTTHTITTSACSVGEAMRR